jgi:hypothetical protein
LEDWSLLLSSVFVAGDDKEKRKARAEEIEVLSSSELGGAKPNWER